MKNEKEEQLLRKRFIELSTAAYYKGTNVYTDFLNLNEISIFHSMASQLHLVPSQLWGGYEGAERVRAIFISYEIGANFSEAAAIDCICIQPNNVKFAEELSHRDYLGAILNLGVERCKIGDILIHEKEAYVFCDTSISSFITMNLEQVKRTKVKSSIVSFDQNVASIRQEEIKGNVSSVRLDSIIATAFHLSRGNVTALIEKELVLVNGRMTASNSYNLKIGDIISVRGYGKFTYKELGPMTKKGRYTVTLLKYC